MWEDDFLIYGIQKKPGNLQLEVPFGCSRAEVTLTSSRYHPRLFFFFFSPLRRLSFNLSLTLIRLEGFGCTTSLLAARHCGCCRAHCRSSIQSRFAVPLSFFQTLNILLQLRYFHRTSFIFGLLEISRARVLLFRLTMALMGAMSIPKPLLTLLLVAASVAPSEALITSWWNTVASQVVVLNETTGQYRYTRCNSMGMDTIYYSTTGGNYLNFTESPPKVGSPLAGSGWFDQTYF